MGLGHFTLRADYPRLCLLLAQGAGRVDPLFREEEAASQFHYSPASQNGNIPTIVFLLITMTSCMDNFL
jgi:hypothetical protein